MKVTMTGFARQQLRETANYIAKEFGEKPRESFMQKVLETKQLLETNPYSGAIEPLLSDLPTTYRSVVVTRLSKMVYRIIDDRIEIAAFWDCRREPRSLANQVG